VYAFLERERSERNADGMSYHEFPG
jgi:hypothetical protein